MADCDLALRLLPLDPLRSPTDLGEEADRVRRENTAAAKACLHRGKSLLVLRRPKDALEAYADARSFKALSEKPATAELPARNATEWPTFLREYVAQAKAALLAEEADANAQQYLDKTANTSDNAADQPHE